MKQAAALFALGWLAIVVESALADLLPIRVVPALGFGAAMAAAILVPGIPGLLVAFALGLGSDMLSGALLGQHALVRMLEFATVRVVAGQLDLRRGLPVFFLSAILAFIEVALLAAISRLFLGGFPFHWLESGAWAARALVTGITTPFLLRIASRIGDLLSEDARREMRLETRRPTL